nr:hypothetical protein N8D75_17905 [Curtobacterium flaccumfaciens]
MTGIATVISVWIAAAAMLFPNVRGKNSMLPTGVVFWAIGCSLQAPWLYVVVDRFLGGENLTNLLYRSAVIVALGCLEVMVIRAMSGSRIRLVEAGVWAVTFVMIATQSALFMAADWSVSDPYLGRYTGEPLRELFAAILPICVGLFGIQVLRVAFKGLPGYGEWTTRWGVSLIGVAAVVDLLWVSESLVIGVVRATVAPHALMTGNVEPLWEIAVVSMCVVTAVGVVVAAAHPVLVPACDGSCSSCQSQSATAPCSQTPSTAFTHDPNATRPHSGVAERSRSWHSGNAGQSWRTTSDCGSSSHAGTSGS